MHCILFVLLLFSSCIPSKFIKETPTKFPRVVDIWELDYLQKTLNIDKYLLIDVRSSQLYDKGHIEGALSLPYKQLRSITNIPNYEKQRIILYDQKHIKYKKISRILFDLNITNFYLLEKGYIFWKTNTLSQ